MTLRNRLVTLVVAGFLSSLLPSSCRDRQEAAQGAIAQYQAALAGGDLAGARLALQQLLQADDANAEHWIELARVSLQLEDYGGAYNAFARAHELDRANAEVLSALTQLALRSGNLELAEQHARELDVVAPDDPAIPLTKGYLALRRNDLDEAKAFADQLVSKAPDDPSGKILLAQILLAEGKTAQAAALLEEHVRVQPSDALSLRALVSIYTATAQWAEAAASGRKLLDWRPQDQQARVKLIEVQLRAGQTDAALATTVEGLANVEQLDVDRALWPWLALNKADQVAPEVLAYGRRATHGRRIAAARFLAMANQPEGVLELLGTELSGPVEAGNATSKALLARALAQSGKVQDGMRLFDEVLTFDESNMDALRGRAETRSERGSHQLAIEDAQRLVAGNNRSVAAHLLLARVHVAAGDRNAARRWLWTAFHDLAGDRLIFEALSPLVAQIDGQDAARRLAQEFTDRRKQEVIRGLA